MGLLPAIQISGEVAALRLERWHDIFYLSFASGNVVSQHPCIRDETSPNNGCPVLIYKPIIW